MLELFLQRRDHNDRLFGLLQVGVGRNMKALRINNDNYNWAWKFHLPGFTRRFPGMVKFMQHGILFATPCHITSFSTSWSTRTQSWRCGHEKSQVRDLVTRNRYCAFCALFFDVTFPRYEVFSFPFEKLLLLCMKFLPRWLRMILYYILDYYFLMSNFGGKLLFSLSLQPIIHIMLVDHLSAT